MLITEELFLLLRRDDGKAESAFSQNGYGLSAAVITDLILAGDLALTRAKDPRLTVVADESVGDDVLDAALERLREREGKRLSSLVTDGKLNPESRVAESLSKAGVIRIERSWAWGLVPAKYPILDPSPEAAARSRLRRVLGGGAPTAADGALLSILQGLDLAAKVLPEERGTLSNKQLRQRIEEVSAESVVEPAVAKAMQAMNAAVAAAVFVPVVVGGAS